MQLTESHSVCAQVIDRSVNWSVVESLSQPAVSQSDLSPPVCHKSLTLSLSHAAWLSLCHPSNYQSATIFATSSNIRSVAQSVCNQCRVISLSCVSYHGKSCAVHVAVALSLELVGYQYDTHYAAVFRSTTRYNYGLLGLTVLTCRAACHRSLLTSGWRGVPCG